MTQNLNAVSQIAIEAVFTRDIIDKSSVLMRRILFPLGARVKPCMDDQPSLAAFADADSIRQARKQTNENQDMDSMSDSANDTTPKTPVVPGKFLYPFVLVTTLFALWGFANDMTNPLVRAFKEIFLISNAQSSLVQ